VLLHSPLAGWEALLRAPFDSDLELPFPLEPTFDVQKHFDSAIKSYLQQLGPRLNRDTFVAGLCSAITSGSFAAAEALLCYENLYPHQYDGGGKMIWERVKDMPHASQRRLMTRTLLEAFADRYDLQQYPLVGLGWGDRRLFSWLAKSVAVKWSRTNQGTVVEKALEMKQYREARLILRLPGEPWTGHDLSPGLGEAAAAAEQHPEILDLVLGAVKAPHEWNSGELAYALYRCPSVEVGEKLVAAASGHVWQGVELKYALKRAVTKMKLEVAGFLVGLVREWDAAILQPALMNAVDIARRAGLLRQMVNEQRPVFEALAAAVADAAAVAAAEAAAAADIEAAAAADATIADSEAAVAAAAVAASAEASAAVEAVVGAVLAAADDGLEAHGAAEEEEGDAEPAGVMNVPAHLVLEAIKEVPGVLEVKANSLVQVVLGARAWEQEEVWKVVTAAIAYTVPASTLEMLFAAPEKQPWAPELLKEALQLAVRSGSEALVRVCYQTGSWEVLDPGLMCECLTLAVSQGCEALFEELLTAAADVGLWLTHTNGLGKVVVKAVEEQKVDFVKKLLELPKVAWTYEELKGGVGAACGLDDEDMLRVLMQAPGLRLSGKQLRKVEKRAHSGWERVGEALDQMEWVLDGKRYKLLSC
jgi:hypothetical protein